jgi:transcriptional/translational regulatory protein YebC/TACO1
MEAALEAGAEDVATDTDGSIEVLTAPENFHTVLDAMTRHGLKPDHTEVQQRAAVAAPVAGEDAEKLLKLLEALEELDDVQHVYSNADIPDEILAHPAG